MEKISFSQYSETTKRIIEQHLMQFDNTVLMLSIYGVVSPGDAKELGQAIKDLARALNQ